MQYSEIRPLLKTGDLVFFSGKSAISHFIKRFTLSEFSHVGMVVRSYRPNVVCLWESTTLSNIASIDGEYRKGVQLVELSKRLVTYDGTVAFRRLRDSLDLDQLDHISELRTTLHNRPYEQHALDLIYAAVDIPGFTNKGDLSSLFCSELVAEVYIRLGIISNDQPSDEYTPADLVNIDPAASYNGHRLGALEYLDTPNAL